MRQWHKKRAFRTGIQQIGGLARGSRNVWTCCRTTCWTIAWYRSEMLFLSLSFYLWTEPVLRTFLYVDTTVVWLMVMESFDMMLSGKSFYKNRRMMAMESMTAFNLLLRTRLWTDSWRWMYVELKTYQLTSVHHRFWAWYISTCHGRNL